MTDYFSALDEPRRPWLDPDALKKKFLTLSAAAHPDRAHILGEEEKRAAQSRYTELNQAYNQLRNPKERLQHLLELETGARPQQVQQVPADLIEFFFELGQLFKQTDAFLAQKAGTSSPILQAQLFDTGQGWTERLSALRQRLNERQGHLLADLRDLDSRWIGEPQPEEKLAMLRRLEELYRLFGYFARWESQIQEKIVQLSL